MSVPIIVVHGGAAEFERDRHPSAQEGCAAAARAGLEILRAGGSALDAVVAAVHVLEDHPDLNAGTGAVLTRAGTVELDASIMDGHGLRFGGVAGMPATRHPIDVARQVMEDGEHALLCADGARVFAQESGIPLCEPEELITARARQRLEAERARRQALPPGSDSESDPGPCEPGAIDPGTVGACAIDSAGHVAAATSTGGMTFKRPGRIGDTPLCGCGTYADDRGGAASATGVGETIIRVTMTRRCVDLMRDGQSASDAARTAVGELGEDVSGEGGIICCDRDGRIGAAHNSPHMPHAVATIHDGEARIIAGIALEDGAELAKP